MNNPIIKNWSIITRMADTYQAPEQGTSCLTGEVYEDNRFHDGEIITTGTIVMIDIKERKAATKRTQYRLGSPEKNFIEWLDKRGSKLEDYKI